jgi:hypothetical protein
MRKFKKIMFCINNIFFNNKAIKLEKKSIMELTIKKFLTLNLKIMMVFYKVVLSSYNIYTLNSDKVSKIWDEMRIKFGCNENKICML